MSLNGLAWLLVSAILANLPFLTERRFAVLPPLVQAGKVVKPFWFRLLELTVYYGLSLGFGWLLESIEGQVAPQRWGFYAITALFFLVLAYPGFVWRFLRKR